MTVPALDPFVEFIRSTRLSQIFRDEVGWLHRPQEWQREHVEPV